MSARCFLIGLVGLFAIAGCGGHGGRPPVFVDEPAVTRVRDTHAIPMPPERAFRRLSYIISNFSLKQGDEILGVSRPGPALDVNSLGEVPASSWYAGTAGRLTPAAVAGGAGGDDPGPESHRPWTVTGLKVGGRNPGFVFKDARGVRYICKFDKPEAPVISTAAGAVAARLFWALGYHTPDDRVVFFAASDLNVDPGATIENNLGEERPLLADDITRMLEDLPDARAGDGYRALVSRFLPGRPRGGFSLSGTNPDDANDRIPHEDRRSQRALRVFGAWLNHVDLKEDNTLDLYVGEADEGHLRHYLVDFDGCLGGYWAARHESRIGYAYDFDWREFFGGIPSLGLNVHPYEDLVSPEHPQVGVFTEDAYDPAIWRANYANPQVTSSGPADAYWAGSVLADISDAMIAAAVTAAQFPDTAATEVLRRVLIKRRDATLAWSLRQVSPVENLTAHASPGGFLHVSAVSTLRRAGVDDDLYWQVDVLDGAGDRLAVAVRDAPRPAVEVAASLLSGERYVVLRWIATDERGVELPPTDAHYVKRDDGWQLVGVTRDGA